MPHQDTSSTSRASPWGHARDSQEEAAQSSLLKKAQQRRAQGLVICRRDLLHTSLIQDEASVYSLEFQVLGDVCMHQDAHLQSLRGLTPNQPCKDLLVLVK